MYVKLLSDDATMPTKVHDDDAGFDVYSPIDTVIMCGQTKKIGLGIAIKIARGTVAIMSERSGMAMRSGITSIGNIIDAGYRGEISIILTNLGEAPLVIDKGDRIGQIVVLQLADEKLQQVDELDTTDRGGQGYGSSGK